jgi:hypothetical protein
MPSVVAPLDPVRRVELQRLTEDNGFGLDQGETLGWRRFTGLAISHALFVAMSADGYWLVGMAHPGVMSTLTADHQGETVQRPDGGVAILVTELGPAIRRMARLARSLPTAPLDAFQEKTKSLPKTTEAERLVVQRVGQDVFRDALLNYWNACCPLTGIAHPRLLRASHLKPWARCESDAERLDVHNGLLLAAHLDAAFDAGLIGFEDDGSLLVAPALTPEERHRLRLAELPKLSGLTDRHLPYLGFHRKIVFQDKGGD